MRAYFVYYAPKTANHKPRLVASVPTADRIFQYVKDFTNGTTAEWQDGNWGLASPPNEEAAIKRHTSAVTANGVPMREWAIDIPEKIYANPLHRSQADSAAAPVNKWLTTEAMKFDATDSTVGYVVPTLSTEDYKDYLRRRIEAMMNDALGAIALRTATVGQREVPKVEPIKGQPQYLRPNGEVYYARKWGSHTDVEVMRKAREIGKTVYLKSMPGTGKTALTEAAFGADLYTIVCSANTEEQDLFGTYVPIPGTEGAYEWFNGPLVRAALEGKVMFLDEVGLADSRVLSPVYPLMDGRDEITIPATGETVKAKKGFMIVAATNPNAPGVRMSEALLSRLDLKAEMTTDYNLLEKVMGVNAQICRVSANLMRRVKDGDLSWAPQMRELLAFHEIEKTFGTEFAVTNLLTDVPEQDEDEIQNAFYGALAQRYEGAEIV